jgi:hypothetical protein
MELGIINPKEENMKTLFDKKGQGMTEYIVILGIIVAIAVALLWPKLNAALTGKLDNIAASIKS